MNTHKVSLLIFGLAFGAMSLAAQVAVSPWKSPHVTFTDTNGVPLTGGCVFSYSGGTSTPLATYTDSSGNTPNADPVVLDATGSAQIWLGPSTYKFAIWSAGGTNCASGTLQWTVDNVPGNIFNNTTITGGTWIGGTITGAAISGGTISGAAITNSTIDSTPIGQTTPASGSFTSLASAFNAMSFSATPVFAAGSYGYFSMTLTHNVTSSSITGGTDGQLITFDLCQNGTGQVVNGITTGFTFAWPSNYTNPPIVNPILNACTITTAFYEGGFWTTVSTSQQLLVGNFDTVPYSATPIFPAESYSNFAITLTNNVTLSTITGGTTGQLATIDVCQSGTGGYTFVWPTNVLQAPTVSAAANSCTGITAIYNGVNWVTVANSSATTMTPLTGNLQIIPFTATPVFATLNYSSFEMVLSGNVTSSSISGGVQGQHISIVLKQGSSTTTAPVSAPTATTVTTGGLLPATSTYYAQCSYIFGTTESLPSAESSESTGLGSTNSITWSCPVYAGVTLYKFYLGTGSGAEGYWVTSSSASWTQTDLPNRLTPGLPYSSGIYTFSWPTNLINPPVMTTGIGASTGLIAVYDGTYWNVIGSSGNSYASGSNTNGYWIKDPLGHIHQWGHLAGETTSCNAITFPVAFTSVATITPTATDDFAQGSSVEHSLVINASHGCTGISTTVMYDWVSSTGGNGVWWTADGY